MAIDQARQRIAEINKELAILYTFENSLLKRSEVWKLEQEKRELFKVIEKQSRGH